MDDGRSVWWRIAVTLRTYSFLARETSLPLSIPLWWYGWRASANFRHTRINLVVRLRLELSRLVL